MKCEIKMKKTFKQFVNAYNKISFRKNESIATPSVTKIQKNQQENQLEINSRMDKNQQEMNSKIENIKSEIKEEVDELHQKYDEVTSVLTKVNQLILSTRKSFSLNSTNKFY